MTDSDPRDAALTRDQETHVCSLCGDTFTGWGNNPEPLRNYSDGVCCDICNDIKVIPARLGRLRAAQIIETLKEDS